MVWAVKPGGGINIHKFPAVSALSAISATFPPFPQFPQFACIFPMASDIPPRVKSDGTPAASSTVYVEGPSGRVDVSAQLRGHFAVLAAYRAAQIAPGPLSPP